MKSLILSDIHSNIIALETIWQHEQDSDLICCTGDLVDYGPFPKEVLDWVRHHGVICSQGNHDRWLANVYRSVNNLDEIPSEDRAWIHHNASFLNDEDISFLESLPQSITFNLDEIDYGMIHLYRDYEEIPSLYAYTQFLKEAFGGENNTDFPRLILGHTHRQSVHYLSDKVLWMNPGSVSYRRPDDPDQTAHYATIIDGKISLKRIPYDLAPLRRQVEVVTLKQSEIQAAERFFGPHSSQKG